MSSALLSIVQKSGEPRPSRVPEPCFEIEQRYELTGGADVASLVFSNPRLDVHLGSQHVETARVEVVRVGHAHATREGSGTALAPTFGDSFLPITFRVALPLALIETIQRERTRQGADKELVFDIQPNLGMAPIHAVSVGPKTVHLAGVTQVIRDQQLQRSPVRFSRDAWLKLIEKVGYTSVLVVELPVSNANHPAVRAALERLQAARTSFAHGNLDEVGVAAFKAFETLVPNLGGRRVFDAIRDEYFSKAHADVAVAAKDMLIELAALYHIGGRHHAGGAPVARHHARFLLGAAELVVAWCADLS